MKKIIIITAIFSLFSYSCQDFLTEDYLSGENSVTLTTSEDGMERLVVASYIFLRVWYAKENQWDLTESGTDLYTWGLDNRSAGYCTYTGWVGEEQDRMAAMWFELYTALNSCNLGLRDIDKLSYENSELQEARKGELHFLRAHYLWLIVENWGPVHFMLDPVEEAIYTANKTPISVFYEQIILDLEAALDHVQESTSEYGRITEPITRAFLARIHLMWASYLKNGLNINGQVFVEPDYAESQVHYDLALDYAEEVMNDYNYQLLGNWEDIWDIDNIKNEEVVWAVNYSDDPIYTVTNLINPWDGEDPYNQRRAIQRDGGHQGHLMYEIRYENLAWGLERDVNNGRGFQRWMPTKHFIDLYDENLDQRFFASFKDTWYANLPDENLPKWRPFIYIDGVKTDVPQEKWAQPMFHAGDTAIYFSKTPVPASQKAKISPNDIYYIHPEKGYRIFDINDMYLPDGSPNAVISRQYYFPITKKYMDPTRLDESIQYSKRDAYVMRISEMYLIAAEAALETSDADAALTYLKSLAESRSASGDGAELLSGYGINSGADLSIDFLLDERARELATEGLRYWDLKRTGKLVERVQAYNTDASPNIREHHQLRFIPQEQLDAVRNKDEFTQNPGY